MNKRKAEKCFERYGGRAGISQRCLDIAIDVKIYKWESLCLALIAKGVPEAERPKLESILKECGSVSGETYVLLNNEYYGDYNPFYNVATLIDSAFNVEDSFDVFLEGEYGVSSVEMEDVAEKYGFELKEED